VRFPNHRGRPLLADSFISHAGSSGSSKYCFRQAAMT
jgi:hypothetical protein